MDIWAYIAGALMLMAVALSFYEISHHLCNFSKPYLQRYIIRILFMVPIYSINAWTAMIVPVSGVYLDSLREVYESFVIYSFMKYLLNFLQYDTNLQQYIDYKPGPKHIFPFCLLPNCIGGKTFMVRCKHGILQYVVVRPITTLIAFVSQLFDFYGEGTYDPFSGYTYPVLLVVNNASQLLAMYCLVIFYTGYQQELHPMRPLSKFFSIKLVVFFSFFQSVVISGLLEIDAVEETMRGLFPELDTKVGIARKMQEFLICVDMIIAAGGHLMAFSHIPYIEDDYMDQYYPAGRGLGGRYSSSDNLINSYASSRRNTSRGCIPTATCCYALFDTLDFTDEKSDFREHFGQLFQRIRQFFTFGQPLPVVVSASNRTNQMSDVWMNQGNGQVDYDEYPEYDSESSGPRTTRVPINELSDYEETK